MSGRNLLVWGNPANGVDINGNATRSNDSNPAAIAHGVKIYNVTSAMNGERISVRRKSDHGNSADRHILQNNVSYSGSSTTVNPGNIADHNTFNGPSGSPAGLGATAADFVSVRLQPRRNGQGRQFSRCR